MAHGHAHHGHGHGHHGGGRDASRRGLLIALGLTLAVFGVEVAGGIVGGSLALLADAGHLLTDAGSLVLALVAVHYASRPPEGRHTFGWQRAEILAALVNGAALLAIGAITIYAAIGRLFDPSGIDGWLTIGVAIVGLIFNLGSAEALRRAGGGINVRAALGHVLADAAASAGVIVAALIYLATGWRGADPVASIGIAVLIMLGAIGIVRDAVDVLMEAAPEGVDVEQLGRALAAVEGVAEVHDLHVWTVTSGFPAVAAHMTVQADAEPWLVRARSAEMLRNHFGVEHTTLQVEREGDEHRLLQIRQQLRGRDS